MRYRRDRVAGCPSAIPPEPVAVDLAPMRPCGAVAAPATELAVYLDRPVRDAAAAGPPAHPIRTCRCAWAASSISPGHPLHLPTVRVNDTPARDSGAGVDRSGVDRQDVGPGAPVPTRSSSTGSRSQAFPVREDGEPVADHLSHAIHRRMRGSAAARRRRRCRPSSRRYGRRSATFMAKAESKSMTSSMSSIRMP